jgi:hypothetical protein
LESLNQRPLRSAFVHQGSSFDLYIQTYRDLAGTLPDSTAQIANTQQLSATKIAQLKSDSYFNHRPPTRLDMLSSSGKLVGSSVLIFLAVGLAAAFVGSWPRPVSLILAGTSLLCVFAALLALCGAAKPEYAPQAQKVIFLTSGCFGLAFAGLAWKYRASARAFSAASLVALAILCFGAIATFFFIRQTKRA